MKNRYQVLIGDVPFEIITQHRLNIFEEYLTDEAPAESVMLSEEQLRLAADLYPPDEDEKNIELTQLAFAVSTKLLSYQRVIFHGVAFLWRGKAWLLAAPSKTGKTTHYALWKKLYGNELAIINGDKPILSCGKDERIWVSSSPWSGKEHMRQSLEAPLGGVIFLKQGETNRVSRLNKRDALIPFYRQFIVYPVSGSHLQAISELEEKILDTAPVWLLENRGDEEAAIIMNSCLKQYLEEKNAL